MKWKTDLHLNKTEVRVSSVVEKLGEATQACLKRLKRKSPSSYKEEEVKRLKKDDGHDDQGPSHHEGVQKGEGVAAEAEATKTAKTSKNQSYTQNRPTHLQKHLKPQKTLYPLQRYISHSCLLNKDSTSPLKSKIKIC